MVDGQGRGRLGRPISADPCWSCATACTCRSARSATRSNRQAGLADVRIAILGAGAMGTAHAAAYAAMPEVSVVGVCSRDPARAAAVAALCKAHVHHRRRRADPARRRRRHRCLPAERESIMTSSSLQLEAGEHMACESQAGLGPRAGAAHARRRPPGGAAGCRSDLLMRSVSAYGSISGLMARSSEQGAVAQRGCLAARLLPACRHRSQGALRRSVDRVDDLRLRRSSFG